MDGSTQTDRLPGLSVPHSYDAKLRKITIRNATRFPKELFAYADAIEILDMSNGQLHELPDDLGRLDRLRIAFFSNNPLGSVPKALAGCATLEMVGLKSCNISTFEDDTLPQGLRGLILTDNAITALPPSIGKHSLLQKLMLAGNNIRKLPQEMAQCRSLQLLRVPANALSEVPGWLWDLPDLSWYSDAANPVSHNSPPHTPKMITWQQLQIEDKLGESAKNIVYRARLKESGQEVAVKLYGVGITTDGHPQDEMYASIVAGAHPNLIPIIGSLADAPEGRRGLVMELIPPSFGVPGLPPDFVTLTRDVMVDRFALPVVINALRSICAALEHLHKRGVMHGDVYAHNILMNPEGKAYLGDLGAASPYEVANDDGKHERIDVRGFGYLVDDLLGCVAVELANRESIERLSKLRDGCINQGTNAFTRFSMVHDALRDL